MLQGGSVISGEGDSTSTSLTLLERARRNDGAAWEEIVRLYTPLVRRWCKLSRLRVDTAEDVTLDVFARAWEKFATFCHDRENATFRGWLREITRNLIVDLIRQWEPTAVGGSSALRRFADVPAAPCVAEMDREDEESLAHEKYLLYRRAIELMELSFEAKTVKAFWMGLAGHSGKEIAKELEMTPNAVFTAKSRILKRLRDEFGDSLDLGKKDKL